MQTIHVVGMGLAPGPSVQADIEETETTRRKGLGFRGTQDGEAERLEPRALRNKEEASTVLSIPLSLGGWSQHRLEEEPHGVIPGSWCYSPSP